MRCLRGPEQNLSLDVRSAASCRRRRRPCRVPHIHTLQAPLYDQKLWLGSSSLALADFHTKIPAPAPTVRMELQWANCDLLC